VNFHTCGDLLRRGGAAGQVFKHAELDSGGEGLRYSVTDDEVGQTIERLDWTYFKSSQCSGLFG
jgi:hypothetical protein